MAAEQTKLSLRAADLEDMSVIASMVQDALVALCDVSYLKEENAFVLVLNRFCWEDSDAAEAAGQDFQRSHAGLRFDSVEAVQARGLDLGERDKILDLLTIAYDCGQGEGKAHAVLHFAGGGAIRLTVEAIEATLKDVTRPYQAPSGQAPHHPE